MKTIIPMHVTTTLVKKRSSGGIGRGIAYCVQQLLPLPRGLGQLPAVSGMPDRYHGHLVNILVWEPPECCGKSPI